MAKDGRTEKATPRRREEAISKGQVVKSKEISNLMTYIAFFIGVMFFQPYLATIFYKIIKISFEQISLGTNPMNVVIQMVYEAIPMIIGLFALIFVFVMFGYFLRVGFSFSPFRFRILFSPKAVAPQLKRLNPASYFKNVANLKKSGFELSKNLILFALISIIVINLYIKNISELQSTILLSWSDSVFLFTELFKDLAIQFGLVFLVLGIIDFAFQKHQYEDNLKMKKHEVKEDLKNQQGDMEMKNYQKAARRKILEKQVKKKVEDAQFVIVNPTHYAVALRYKKHKKDALPRVMIKGVDELALLIKEIAKENDIPIIENKPLARKIYAEVEEDEYINEELFQVIGKIIAKLVMENRMKID